MTQLLEFTCLKRAIDWLPFIPEPFWISVNLGPDLFMSSEFQHYVTSLQIMPLLPRVVFELTEHLPIESAVKLHAVLKELRSARFKLSLDDTGCGFFDMRPLKNCVPKSSNYVLQ
jgi:EAL domain-containing protein (putative c-di-GMP-specific phosphodiesterase class I)